MKDMWWLSINHHSVGTTHRSLTQKLFFSRYIACEVLTLLKVEGKLKGHQTVRIMKDGIEQSKDVILYAWFHSELATAIRTMGAGAGIYPPYSALRGRQHLPRLHKG